MILVIDFGSQTTHLIARRVRELGVKVKIISPEKAIQEIKNLKPKGLIFSGGPASVYQKQAPTIDKQVFKKGIPILGICYGLQLTAYLLNGKVIAGKKKEYGPATLTIHQQTPLFSQIPPITPVWMSHGDEVIKPPKGAKVIASTETIKVAAFANEKAKLYGIQFHPEVIHTPLGKTILQNFVEKICSIKTKKGYLPPITELVNNLKEQIGKEKAVCALSGGVDSSTAAVLVHKAIGKRLTCIYVDTGLMRKGETSQIISIFKKHFQMNLKVVKAQDKFLQNLKGITDPEEKRKIIGNTFIRIFEQQAKKIGGAKYLIQGTVYPDVIESAGSALADRIKTHHNVAGLPKKHGFTIIEPLRYFYKDEVRLLAKRLKLPKEIITRHVFPGPGLAVRIIGAVTKEKLALLREADAIVTEELKKAGWYQKLWMGFAVFAGIKTTGVAGDERRYGETIAIRAVTSKDAMTADFARLPYPLLAKISSRIVNEIPAVTRVVYDITTKPPATMEWE